MTVARALANGGGQRRGRSGFAPGDQVTGAVMREHGAPTHKGVEGRIVELNGGRYAWIEPAPHHAGTTAA